MGSSWSRLTPAVASWLSSPHRMSSSIPATPLNRCASASAISSVSEDLNVGAQGIEPVGQVLIATIDYVDISQHRLSARGEHAKQTAHRGPQRWRTDHLLTTPARRALHDDPVWVEQLHPCSKPIELGEVDRPVLINPVVDDRLALSGRRDHRKEGQVIDVQPRKGHWVDLVDGGAQLRWPYGQIHQPRVAVRRQVLLAEREVQTHLLHDRELDFEKLDRRPLDRQV